MAKRIDTQSVLDVPCEFKGVRYGDETASLGIAIPYNSMTPTQAAHYFRGARCEVSIRADPEASEDAPGQGRFDELDTDKLDSVVDFPSIRMGAKNWGGATVSFSLESLDDAGVLMLAHLAKKRGRLKARRIGDIVRKGKADDDGDGDEGDEGDES